MTSKMFGEPKLTTIILVLCLFHAQNCATSAHPHNHIQQKRFNFDLNDLSKEKVVCDGINHIIDVLSNKKIGNILCLNHANNDLPHLNSTQESNFNPEKNTDIPQLQQTSENKGSSIQSSASQSNSQTEVTTSKSNSESVNQTTNLKPGFITDIESTIKTNSTDSQAEKEQYQKTDLPNKGNSSNKNCVSFGGPRPGVACSDIHDIVTKVVNKLKHSHIIKIRN